MIAVLIPNIGLSPDVLFTVEFESIEILGLEECISRIQDCINTL